MNDDERVREERAQAHEEALVELQYNQIELRRTISQVWVQLGILERRLDELEKQEGELPY